MTTHLQQSRASQESAVLGISGGSIHHAGVRKQGETVVDPVARAARRRGRFDLLRAAQSILHDHEKPAAAQHATCWCHRVSFGAVAGVWRTVDGSTSRMSGLVTCGLVWTCPPCAAKITEQRREELNHALVKHVKEGGAAYLMTLTFPHERDEYPLIELLVREAKALQGFKNSKTFKRLMGKVGSAGRIGSVRSREVTHGRNGWHPHEHELIFCKRLAFGEGPADERGSLSAGAIDELRGAWIHQLVKHGLCPNAKTEWAWKYALDMRGGEHAAEYIAKFGRDERWGASSEMTGHLAKVGRREVEGDKHRTPFQILDDAKHGNAESCRLFREYAEAFKGKRQLTWSPGLKKALGVNDRSDEEIAAEDRPKAEERYVGEVGPEGLALIASRAALGEFHEFVALACSEEGQGQLLIDDFLDMLRSRPPTSRPTILQGRKKSALDGSRRMELFGSGTAMYDQRL